MNQKVLMKNYKKIYYLIFFIVYKRLGKLKIQMREEKFMKNSLQLLKNKMKKLMDVSMRQPAFLLEITQTMLLNSMNIKKCFLIELIYLFGKKNVKVVQKL